MSRIDWNERQLFLESKAMNRTEYYKYRRLKKKAETPRYQAVSHEYANKIRQHLDSLKGSEPHNQVKKPNDIIYGKHNKTSKNSSVSTSLQQPKTDSVATGTNALPILNPRFTQLSIDHDAEWNPWC
jgi:hypothetical protein